VQITCNSDFKSLSIYQIVLSVGRRDPCSPRTGGPGDNSQDDFGCTALG